MPRRQWTRGALNLSPGCPREVLVRWQALYDRAGLGKVADECRRLMRVPLPRCVNCWRDMVLCETPSGKRTVWLHHHSRSGTCWTGAPGQVEPWKTQGRLSASQVA